MVDLRHNSHGSDRRARCLRRGFSLLELMATLALLGLLVVVSVRYAPDTLGNLSSKVDARRLALDLVHCRRAAIASGDNHLIVFQYSGTKIVGYTAMRRVGAATVAIESARTFPSDVTVTVTPSAPEFTFEGAALAGTTITLAATNRTSQVVVAAATGTVTVNDL